MMTKGEQIFVSHARSLGLAILFLKEKSVNLSSNNNYDKTKWTVIRTLPKDFE